MRPRRKRRGIWRRGAGACRSNAGMRAASKSKAKDARGAPAAAPPAMPDLPDDAVVAIFGDGTKFTMGNFRKVFEALPPVNQQMALRNREQWLHQWELFRKLTKMAEDAKLDQESPYKETLAYQRMTVLATAQINSAMNLVVVEPGEIVKYYDSNKRKYTQVRVKAIYIAE